MSINNDQRKPEIAQMEEAPENLVTFPKEKRRPGGKPGNRNAWKHGIYADAFNEAELAERAKFEADLIADTGGAPPTGVRALIHTAGMLKMKLDRCDLAIRQGYELPSERVLAWCNSFRLILGQVGLERRQRPGLTLEDYLKQRAAEKESQVPHKAEET
jgi:hypothetical protein